MSLVSELTTTIYNRLSLGTGLDVQTYADPKILAMIQHKFNVLFDALWWPKYYTPFETFTLDGSTGVITGDLTTKVKRWEDLRYVWYASDKDPLPKANPAINPTVVRNRCIIPYNLPSKVFKILPITTTGDITIAYRTKPDKLTSESDVGIDDELIITGCCYDFVVDDDNNREAADKFKSMFDNRYRQLVALQNVHGIAIDESTNTSLTEWR